RAAPVASGDAYRQRAPEDEVIYFVLPDRFANGDLKNDRGGLTGNRLKTGFDPADAGFYHGGDLKGLTAKLDYIQGLGATAVWLGPIYKNKPVQGRPGQESAGYHGYWILDFTDVDPHFGTKADLKTFVDAAHARGLKVYLDIVTNHTADVIKYRECPQNDCGYRGLADYPYSRRGGIAGAPINAGFTGANFEAITSPDYAYTPYVPAGEEHAKAPDWLNDPRNYHNRGDTTWTGESTDIGDFVGLDDVFTEQPRVVQGFIDVYGRWIDEFGVDGFRIDTAQHVNPEFWHAFVPAMQARAKAKGIPNFHIFAEIYDLEAAGLARKTRLARLPAPLDYAFQTAAIASLGGKDGTDKLARLFEADALYPDGTPRITPTFVSNHDAGRFAGFLRKARPDISDEELEKRVLLGHALMMFARGVPVIYYGDEQGFVSDANDRDAREDMFPSKVASYNDNRLVAGTKPGPDGFYRTDAPLYRELAAMAAIRAADPALRSGDMTLRAYGAEPGLFAFSRHGADGAETLVAINTSTAPVTAQVRVDPTSNAWRALRGTCAPAAGAPGSYGVTVAPLDYIICAAAAPGEPR
ncbi:alpha-amylase family glycosyl hydrolase, partial [Caulobacter sp. 17J65-9]|uniref:alpha-amylase family glycosyl hydrolase n=1 Tax=Caulobacter sp. 17J65-9 TaxID=2709382 RepID=UPI0013CC1281